MYDDKLGAGNTLSLSLSVTFALSDSLTTMRRAYSVTRESHIDLFILPACNWLSLRNCGLEWECCCGVKWRAHSVTNATFIWNPLLSPASSGYVLQEIADPNVTCLGFEDFLETGYFGNIIRK